MKEALASEGCIAFCSLLIGLSHSLASLSMPVLSEKFGWWAVMTAKR